MGHVVAIAVSAAGIVLLSACATTEFVIAAAEQEEADGWVETVLEQDVARKGGSIHFVPRRFTDARCKWELTDEIAVCRTRIDGKPFRVRYRKTDAYYGPWASIPDPPTANPP